MSPVSTLHRTDTAAPPQTTRTIKTHELLDFGEGETEDLRSLDKSDALDRWGSVHSKASWCAGRLVE